jgi:deoxyribose-phosphate aldolase
LLNIPVLGKEELAARIDHAVLAPGASLSDLEAAIEDLESLGLRCLITTPTLAPIALQLTRRCIGSVAGFPFAYSPIEAKLKEVEDIVGKGVNEVDYVANTQLLLLGREKEYINEVAAAAEICRAAGVTCKIIIETPLLGDPAKIYNTARLLLERTGSSIAFIKTSTGYGPRPTYPEDVAAIRRAITDSGVEGVGVKAAGGIRTALQALYLVALGADIIGTSRPRAIIEGLEQLYQILPRRGE